MQQKIQQFVFLSERLLSEAGELRARKTWNELAAVSVQLSPYMQQLSQSFDPKYALVFLLSCGNDGTTKNGCFSMLFRKILTKIPNEDLLKLLSSVNRVELNTYLLPFLYERGDIGSVAAYISAKLGLKVKFDSFEFFLSSREWSQQDLINLSFLVLVDEKDSLILNLDSVYNTNPKEVFRQFLNILNSSNITEPIIPELLTDETEEKVNITQKPRFTPKQNVNQPPQSNANFKYKLTTSNKVSNTANANTQFSGNANNSDQESETNFKLSTNQNVRQQTSNKNAVENAPIRYVAEQTESSSTTKNVTNSSVKTTNKTVTNNKETGKSSSGSSNSLNNFIDNFKDKLSSYSDSGNSLLKNKPVIITIAIVLIILLYLITKLFGAEDDTNKVIKAPPKVDKIPEYWINAVTNRKITPKYLQADVDYRMGELYLARNLYNEAITFFQSALKTDPTHNTARLRWGFAELQQGNYMVSIQLLKETLKYDSTMQNANLYLARNYINEKKYKDAIKHYKAEFKNYNKLDVGMEYANFLAKIDKHNEAMDVLSRLQESYPGKMLILDSNQEEENSNNRQPKKNNKQKSK